jgi:ABC-type multidrug transport system fused ATPase/permease subunit
VPAWLGRRATEHGRSIRDATGALSSDVVDAVQGIREIVILGAQQQVLTRITGRQSRLSAAATAHGRRAGLEKAIRDGLTGLGMLAVLVIATVLVRHHQLPRADYPAAIVLAAACFLPLIALSGIGRELNRVAAASDVPQDVYLVNISVTDNLRLGRPGASDADIRLAAALAQCTEFVEALPDGWDTILSERGLRLSGGERQRIAVARALLKDTPVIVLDEAVSSLDTESEQAMQLAFGHVMKNRTTLIIAHRPSTIQTARRLVVLDHGRVAETGTYEQLIGAGGTFHAMISEGLLA